MNWLKRLLHLEEQEPVENRNLSHRYWNYAPSAGADPKRSM